MTLVNKQTGNLDIKCYTFDGLDHFDHLQRLGYYSLIWIQEGSGLAKVDINSYTFTEPVLFAITPYQPFLFEADTALKGVVLHFHPDFFCIHYHQEQIACNGVLFNNVYAPPFLRVPHDVTPKLTTLCRQIQLEIQTPSLAQHELLVSYLKIVLITASRLKVHQESQTSSETLQLTETPKKLLALKHCIEAHFKTYHAPADYANLLHMSPKALGKMVKLHFGKTLTDLIAERIVIEAKRELYLTNKSVKEIAFELGYSDEHYFSRFFKNRVDISPKLYRDTVGMGRAEAS